MKPPLVKYHYIFFHARQIILQLKFEKHQLAKHLQNDVVAECLEPVIIVNGDMNGHIAQKYKPIGNLRTKTFDYRYQTVEIVRLNKMRYFKSKVARFYIIEIHGPR